ncbi:MAG: hypothetical protein FJ109_09990 [Deltaproteobacteria bacterium]|nr:hypothetical protein [Deltaproteobacteria bacterium]
MHEGDDDRRREAAALLRRVADLLGGAIGPAVDQATHALGGGQDAGPLSVASLLCSNESSRRKTEAVIASAQDAMSTAKLVKGGGLHQPAGFHQMSSPVSNGAGLPLPPAGQFCVLFPEEAPGRPNAATLRRRTEASTFLGARGARIHATINRPCAILVEAERDDVAEVAARLGAIVSPRYTEEIRSAAECTEEDETKLKGFARTLTQGRDIMGLTPYVWGVAPGAKWRIGLFDGPAYQQHCVFVKPGGAILFNLQYDNEAKKLAWANYQSIHGTSTAHILAGNCNLGSQSCGLTNKALVIVDYHADAPGIQGGPPGAAESFDLWAFMAGACKMMDLGCRLAVLEVHTPSSLDGHFSDTLEQCFIPAMEFTFFAMYHSGIAIISAGGNWGAGRFSWPSISPWPLSVGAYSRGFVPGYQFPTILAYNGQPYYIPSEAQVVVSESVDICYPDLDEINAPYVCTGTPDGRVKPEIYCPTDTVTARPPVYGENESESCLQRSPGRSYGGTSCATPFAAAAAARLLDYFDAAGHVLTPGELYAAMIAATELPDRRAKWASNPCVTPISEGTGYMHEKIIPEGEFENTAKSEGKFLDPILGAGYLWLPEPSVAVWTHGVVTLREGKPTVAVSLPLAKYGFEQWRVRAAIWWKDFVTGHSEVALRLLEVVGGNLVPVATSFEEASVFQKVAADIYKVGYANYCLQIGCINELLPPAVYYAAVAEPLFWRP